MKISAIASGLVVLSSLGLVARFFAFTPDDAYILMLFGENLVDRGTLSFNAGEWISSMTSPAIAMTHALLYGLTRSTVLAAKIFSLSCWGLVALMAYHSTPGRNREQNRWTRVIVLAIVLLTPCMILWSVAAMETMLLAASVTGIAVLSVRRESPGEKRVLAMAALTGLAFVTRFDSVCFTGPLMATTLLAQNWQRRIGAFLVASVLPVAWFAVSLHWYGDLLPTSFYVKTPSFDTATLLENGAYILQHLALSGLVPLALLLALSSRSTSDLASRGEPDSNVVAIGRLTPLALGVSGMLLYGLSSATTHMMFSFRYFVPYLAAATIWIVHWGAEHRSPTPRSLAVFAIGLAAFQLVHARYTFETSLNGFAQNGELRHTSIRAAQDTLPVAERFATALEAHWQSLDKRTDRPPRIFTYAEGIIPYTYREAYYYGDLISYRADCRRDVRRSADYVIRVARVAPNDPDGRTYPELKGRTAVVSEHVFHENIDTKIVAIYNPRPQAHFLPPRLHGPCLR